MNEPLDEQYLTWLYSKIGSTRTTDSHRTYWKLCRQLYTKEFVWIIPNDDNRVEDGRDLRYEFLEENNLLHVDPDWMGLGCSMFELLLGLARRLAFEAEGEPRVWFWHLITNLGLDYVDDGFNKKSNREIDEKLDRLIWRTYEPDGSGGLFPLTHPREDQRRVEIWYQMCAYILERD